MLGPLLQQLRRFEHEQREHRSRAQNPGRSPGKQKDLGFTPAGRPRARRTAALPQGCAAPAGPEAPARQNPLCRLLLSPSLPAPRCWYRLTHLSLGVTEGSSTFSLFHPLKIFITNKGIPFPAGFNHHRCPSGEL